MTRDLRSIVLEGGYWLVAPGPDAELAIVACGAVVPEAIEAHAQLVEDIPGAGLLVVTSPDRLHRGWVGAASARRGRVGVAHRAAAGRARRGRRLVTVLDGHPATLSWLGAVARPSRVPLGVDRVRPVGRHPRSLSRLRARRRRDRRSRGSPLRADVPRTLREQRTQRRRGAEAQRRRGAEAERTGAEADRMLTTKPNVSHRSSSAASASFASSASSGTAPAPSAALRTEIGVFTAATPAARNTRRSIRSTRDNVKDLASRGAGRPTTSAPIAGVQPPGDTARRQRHPLHDGWHAARRRRHRRRDGRDALDVPLRRGRARAAGGAAPQRRGVPYWTDGRGEERILYITPGYHLIALDTKTGDPIPLRQRRHRRPVRGARSTAAPRTARSARARRR